MLIFQTRFAIKRASSSICRVFLCSKFSTQDAGEGSFVAEKSFTEYLKSYNFVTHVFEPWAIKQPNHTALFLTDGSKKEVLSYSEVLKQADELTSALYSTGSPPKCAMVILPKISPWWIINIAGSICEMAISPGSLMLSERDIMYRLKLCNADAIFCDAVTMKKIAKDTQDVPWRILTEETEEEETKALEKGWLSYHQLAAEGKGKERIRKTYNSHSIAQLFFTSGTTGYPKMVPHTQVGYGMGQVTAARDWLKLTTDDLFWNLSDLGWAKSAYSNLYIPFIAGCSVFVHQMTKFDSHAVLKTLETFPISVACLPPTAYRAIVQEDLRNFKPKNLQKCVSAGEALNAEVMEIWKRHTGLVIQEGYGQTESTLSCSTPFGMKVKPGFVGKPVHGFDIRILDKDLNEVGPNEVGQISYNLKRSWPYGLFKGYMNNPELNKKVFVNGYFLTGDNGFFDDEGYLRCVGRNDDIIITAGYRIGPFEVESALIEHPAVVESAVIAFPDEQRGHVVKAVIVLTEKYKANTKTKEETEKLVKEIQEFVKRTIAPYKYPRKIEFVDALPKTNSGKIRRVELRERELQL